jgi:hypothetical protein
MASKTLPYDGPEPVTIVTLVIPGAPALEEIGALLGDNQEFVKNVRVDESGNGYY